MKKASLTILCTAIGLVAMPCAAQTFTYDCDTPGGHFSKLENVANGPDYAITGEVDPRRLYGGSDWLPTALISLNSADGRQQVGIRLLANRPETEDARQGVVRFVTYQKVDSAPQEGEALATVSLGTAVPFSLMLTEGEAIVKVGTVEKRLSFKRGDKPLARVTCSSGEFVFTNLAMPSG
ncbi:hypothetical protein GS397_13035 [Sphingobium yanoikuyae]|uniref:Uncharacterized protein n=2 Tax=Sphingobium yanoikuyae TaxID=13690 RepID=A0A6P1GHG4_SPHYA|nr:hypothetical protein [Sphingobium yanoikuyae]QHD67868.1 hypothetical protein GS397_13035 [Sphingobium yanoikuyae]